MGFCSIRRTVPTDTLQRTNRPGVYAAGNASDGLQAAILAAAEGFKAAYAINEELVDETVMRREKDPLVGEIPSVLSGVGVG